MAYNENYSKYSGLSEIQWNMNNAFLMRLDTRCNERDIAAIEGNILKWYRTLRSIFRNIHFRLIEAGHEEKEKQLIEMFETIKVKLLNSRLSDAVQQQNNFNAIELDLDAIDIQLNDLLHHYKFIYPDNERKEIEEVLKEDY
jgi:hypothetical protein